MIACSLRFSIPLPAVIQSRDGTIHVAYSYFVSGGKTIKHAAFNEQWVQSGS
jgi:hypothetical protein